MIDLRNLGVNYGALCHHGADIVRLKDGNLFFRGFFRGGDILMYRWTEYPDKRPKGRPKGGDVEHIEIKTKYNTVRLHISNHVGEAGADKIAHIFVSDVLAYSSEPLIEIFDRDGFRKLLPRPKFRRRHLSGKDLPTKVSTPTYHARAYNIDDEDDLGMGMVAGLINNVPRVEVMHSDYDCNYRDFYVNEANIESIRRITGTVNAALGPIMDSWNFTTYERGMVMTSIYGVVDDYENRPYDYGDIIDEAGAILW